MSDYARNLISWSLQKLGNLTWLSATARNMTQFQKNLNITVRGGYKVWNDKLIDQKSWSPYEAYRRTGSVIDANKWNPADVWINNSAGQQNSGKPHELVNNSTNTFTFQKISWIPRKVGDDLTNSHPSFVGAKIQQAFFHNNRLGFLSRDNVSMSKSGDYFNFYFTSFKIFIYRVW